MSVAFYIVLDDPEPGFDPFVNGKSLAQHAPAVEQLAEAAAVRSPYDFCGGIPEEFAEFADELRQALDSGIRKDGQKRAARS